MTDINRIGSGDRLLTTRPSRPLPDEHKPAGHCQAQDAAGPSLRLPLPALPYAVSQLHRERKVSLTESEFKAAVKKELTVAERNITAQFGPWLKPVPKAQVNFLSRDEMQAMTGSADTSGAVSNMKPSVINVNQDDYLVRSSSRAESLIKQVVTHEALHTKSAAFAMHMNHEFGGLRPDGNPRTFPGGRSRLSDVVEGLTQRFTNEALGMPQEKAGYFKPSPDAYTDAQIWADRVITNVGAQTVKDAYFGNDLEAKKKVMDAVDGLESNVNWAEKDRRIKERNPPLPPMGY
jgi:hypothetical protein